MLPQVSETLARLVPLPEAPAGSPGGHELTVVVKEHSRKGERHAHIAEGAEAAAKQQPGQDEVAHDGEAFEFTAFFSFCTFIPLNIPVQLRH